MQKTKHARGFTLIEVMFALGIISVLAAVVMVNAQSFRVRANDTARLANLNEMRIALRLYAQANGRYPDTSCSGSGWIGYGGLWGTHQACVGGSPTGGTLTNVLAPYISQPITDPDNPMINGGGNPDTGYLYTGNGTSYCIMAYKLPENMNNYPSNVWDTNRCSSVNSAGQCTGAHATKAVYYTVISAGDTYAAGWSLGC